MVSSSKVEYVQTGQLVVANYVKNTKAIGFLWAIFSICYAIITLVIFIQPQWVGTTNPVSPGYFSPWKHCSLSSIVTDSSSKTDFSCRGRLDDFSSILSPTLKIATGLIGVSAIVAVLSVFALILFLCAPTPVAYHVVAWMQTFAAIATAGGLLVFPLGWDAPEVKLTCGPDADRYNLGNCGFRWAYVLGIIGGLDGLVLAILGFVLGSRHVKLSDELRRRSKSKHGLSSSSYLPSGYYPTNETTTTLPPPSLAMSYESNRRGKGHLKPILLLPPELDAYSEFSRSKASGYKGEYASPPQHFQL